MLAQENSSAGRQLWLLVGVYALALVVRLGYLFILVPTELSTNEGEFYEPAVNIVEGRGYSMVPQQSPDGVPRPTAYRTPGPALVLALVFSVFGHSPLTARVACAVLASASAPLVFLFTRRLGGTNGAALLSGAWIGLYPFWVHYSVLVLSEGLYVPSLLAVVLVTDSAVRSRSWALWFGTGLFWGAVALVRPHALPCVAVILMLTLWRWPALFTRVLVLGLGIAIVLGVWTGRNTIVLGHPVILATEGGETLLGANNPSVWQDPELSGMWKAPVAIPEYRDHLSSIRDEVDRDREQNRLAFDFLSDNWSLAPEHGVRKLWCWLTPVPNSSRLTRALVLCSYGFLLVFLAVGAWRGSLRPSYLLSVAAGITLVSCAITIVYWGNLTRGRFPLEATWLPWGSLVAWETGIACVKRLRPGWSRPISAR